MTSAGTPAGVAEEETADRAAKDVVMTLVAEKKVVAPVSVKEECASGPTRTGGEKEGSVGEAGLGGVRGCVEEPGTEGLLREAGIGTVAWAGEDAAPDNLEFERARRASRGGAAFSLSMGMSSSSSPPLSLARALSAGIDVDAMGGKGSSSSW